MSTNKLTKQCRDADRLYDAAIDRGLHHPILDCIGGDLHEASCLEDMIEILQDRAENYDSLRKDGNVLINTDSYGHVVLAIEDNDAANPFEAASTEDDEDDELISDCPE